MLYQKRLDDMSKLAIENAETAAQLEIKDEVLKQSLLDNFRVQLLNAYHMGYGDKNA